MRILHWYANLLEGGAVSSAVMGLAQAQAADGHEVLIAAADPPGEGEGGPLVPENLDTVLWRPARVLARGPLMVRTLSAHDRKILTRIRPDIVHVHGEPVPDNLRVPSLFECPRVISPHGAFHPYVMKKNRILKLAYLSLARRVLYPGAVFHALSPREKEDIHALMPRHEVFVAPNGPGRITEHAPSPENGARSARRAPGHARLLYAGRLDVRHKGIDMLLDAFCTACAMMPDVDMRLVMAGPDFHGGAACVEGRAQELGIRERVELPGALREGDLAHAYLDADLFVMPSRNDAFSISAAEALYFCTPVILTEEVGVASYPEIRSLPHVAVVPVHAEGIARAIVTAVRDINALRRAAAASLPAVKAAISWQRAASLSLEAYRRAVER